MRGGASACVVKKHYAYSSQCFASVNCVPVCVCMIYSVFEYDAFFIIEDALEDPSRFSNIHTQDYVQGLVQESKFFWHDLKVAPSLATSPSVPSLVILSFSSCFVVSGILAACSRKLCARALEPLICVCVCSYDCPYIRA